MNDETTVKVTRLRDGTLLQELPDGTYRRVEGRTDWQRVDKMTDEEAEANALADPDDTALTDDDLGHLRRMPDPRLIRARLKMTQRAFSRAFDLSLLDLQAWEEGRRMPDTAARTYLRVIEQDPAAVLAALDRDTPSRALVTREASASPSATPR